MKVWMWQRLYRAKRFYHVYPLYVATEDMFSRIELTGVYEWLCPKPNLVLVDRKHLGGME